MTRADDPVYTEYTGMKKRELFAAMAMQGMLSSGNKDVFELEYLTQTRMATKYADALIEALNEAKEKP